MKMFLTECRKQANRKFLVIVAAVFLFAFGTSAHTSYQCAGMLEGMKDILIMNAQASVANEERFLAQTKETENLVYREAVLEAAQDRLEAYEKEDISDLIDATLRYGQLKKQANKYGITLDDRSQREAQQAVELCSILVEEGIAVYHEPLLEGSYADGTESVTAFYREYLFLLLPVVCVLLCADTLTAEMRCGSVKVLLGFPNSRNTILLRKYAAGISLVLLTVLGGILGAFLGGTLFSGTGDIRYPIKAPASFFSKGTELYLAQWKLWLRMGVVCLCAVFFFAAISMVIGVLVRSSLFSILTGILLEAGGSVLISQMFLSAGTLTSAGTCTLAGGLKGMLAYLPFICTDGYAMAMGKMSQKAWELQNSSAGLLSVTAENTGMAVIPYAAAVGCVILLVWSVILIGLAAFAFRGKDVA